MSKMSGDTTERAVGLQTPSFHAGEVVISCEPWIWSFKYEQHKLLCAECFRESEGLRVCSNCKLYRYCDKRCQALNWNKEHKHECGMLKKIQTDYIESGREPDIHPRALDKCVAQILVAKAISKFKRGDEYGMSKSNVRLSAAKILEILPYDPAYEEGFQAAIGNLVWDTAEIGDIPNFDALLRKIIYSAFPIWDQKGKLTVIAAGIFPEVLHVEMTPVCWDINVTMDLQGRTLVVRATKDILHYNGLKDLRQNEPGGSHFRDTLNRRREIFESSYRHPCTCYKCTPEYDAEINPLKCSTSECTRRIPSDGRALQPCPQCGAINENRLHRLTELKDKFETMLASEVADRVLHREQLNSFFLELLQADILHPDAHLLFACGFGVFSEKEKSYEETWNICSGMIACIRTVYPKYHLGRAYWLVAGADIVAKWCMHSLAIHDKQSGAKVGKACSLAVEWLKESVDIYGTVSGKGSKWEQHIVLMLRWFATIQGKFP